MGVQVSSRWLRGAVLLVLVCLAAWSSRPLVLWAEEEKVAFDSTGLSITNNHGFLTYWREHDGARLLGSPVTAELRENGLVVQYFERGRLEAHKELAGSPVLLGRVGAEYAAALWQTFAPPPPHSPVADERFFEETGFTLREPFLSFWNAHGALSTFGYPISEPMWSYVGDKMAQVQYFERARLEYYAHNSGIGEPIQISTLGYELALLRGYKVNELGVTVVPADATQASDTAATEEVTVEEISTEERSTEEREVRAATVEEQSAEVRDEVVVVEEEDDFDPLLDPLLAPFGSSPPAEEADWEVSFTPITTTKHVVVSITRQWLYAYEGDTLVFDAPISTGMYGFDTPVGDFFIYAKTPLQTMEGTLNGEHYKVVNVTHAMYIHNDVAIHGTYWHNDFGTGMRRSHGCINLPRQSAAWLFGWAPVGTLVRVMF